MLDLINKELKLDRLLKPINMCWFLGFFLACFLGVISYQDHQLTELNKLVKNKVKEVQHLSIDNQGFRIYLKEIRKEGQLWENRARICRRGYIELLSTGGEELEDKIRNTRTGDKVQKDRRTDIP